MFNKLEFESHVKPISCDLYYILIKVDEFIFSFMLNSYILIFFLIFPPNRGGLIIYFLRMKML